MKLKKVWVTVLDHGFKMTRIYNVFNEQQELIGEHKFEEAIVDKENMIARFNEVVEHG